MHTKRKKKFTVNITDSDRKAVRRFHPDASLASIDRHAVVRAAAREILIETGSTADALNSVAAWIPKATLHSWMKQQLKTAT
jgi:hypothetical protein